MNKHIAGLVFWFHCLIPIVAQEKLLIEHVDTIDLKYRSNGYQLHQIDEANIGTIHLRPAAGFARVHEHHLAENLLEQPAGFAYLPNRHKVAIKRSALPYLGFQYAFGSGLNQAVNVDYHHFFSDSSHLHFRYHRRVSNGIIRNSDFTLNDLHLEFHQQRERLRYVVDAYYGGYDYTENGGIESDSLIGILGIDFIPIRKPNANNEIEKADLNWRNYYALYQDSVLSTGPVYHFNYTINKRKYQETPVIGTGFENIFIDSNQTRDWYQTAELKNGFGYYFSTSFLQVDGTINHRYWRYDNLSFRRDTNEVFIHSNLWMKWKGTEVRNEFYLNTLGALGELYNHSRIELSPLRNLAIEGGVRLDNRLPIPHQRFYFGNNIQWQLPTLNTQQIFHIHGDLRYGDTNAINASLQWTTINNGLYLINNEWRQDTLNFVSVGALNIRGEFNVKKWFFYPSITLRFNTDNFQFQPLFSTRNRIAYKTGLFKAENLIIALGADFGFDTGHQILTWNPLTNTMDPQPSEFTAPSLWRLNFFTSLQIDQFRFFVRAENLDYFINNPKSRIDPNIPITPFLIRLGITWDFFN